MKRIREHLKFAVAFIFISFPGFILGLCFSEDVMFATKVLAILCALLGGVVGIYLGSAWKEAETTTYKNLFVALEGNFKEVLEAHKNIAKHRDQLLLSFARQYFDGTPITNQILKIHPDGTYEFMVGNGDHMQVVDLELAISEDFVTALADAKAKWEEKNADL